MQHTTTHDPRRDFPATTPALRSQELRGHPLDALDQRLCGGGEKTNAHVHSGGGLGLGGIVGCLSNGRRQIGPDEVAAIRPASATRKAVWCTPLNFGGKLNQAPLGDAVNKPALNTGRTHLDHAGNSRRTTQKRNDFPVGNVRHAHILGMPMLCVNRHTLFCWK